MHERRTAACATIVTLVAIAVPAGATHAQAGGEIIPAWIDQIFIYYASDQISASELIMALEYTDNNILQIDHYSTQATNYGIDTVDDANDAVDNAIEASDIVTDPQFIISTLDADLDANSAITNAINVAIDIAHDDAASVDVQAAALAAFTDTAWNLRYTNDHAANNNVTSTKAAEKKANRHAENAYNDHMNDSDGLASSLLKSLASDVAWSHSSAAYMNALAVVESSKADAYISIKHAAIKHADALNAVSADAWAIDAFNLAAAIASDAADEYTNKADAYKNAADAWDAAAAANVAAAIARAI